MPLDLTGIHNVGEFYSHHYLEALLESDLKGVFAAWRDEDEAAPDRRLERCAAGYFAAKQRAAEARRPVERQEIAHRLHVSLLQALGYPYDFGVRFLLNGEAAPVLCDLHRDGRSYLWVVETPFTAGDDSPLEQPLLPEQYPPAGGGQAPVLPAGPWQDVIGEIFRSPEPPRWALLLAGRLVCLIERGKWGYGQYLFFDLDEIFGRRERETLRAAAALLGRESLCPSDGVPVHDTLDENSHKHAYGVSQDLKYGVRRAVELLANEVVYYHAAVLGKPLRADDALARQLTTEALRYLYRLLFLFYAEARAELHILPMQSEAYREGYSLEMLRDLEQTPLTTPQAQNGSFFHDSLERLFKLLAGGYTPAQLVLMDEREGEQAFLEHGFTVNALRSPLFAADSMPLFARSRLRNIVLQEIIQLLSLSRERSRSSGNRVGRRASRGRISYAQLGINQLGAVYEGLLSYSGFFAAETLYEVKPAGSAEADETQQTWFVPASQRSRYTPEEFVYVEQPDGSRQRKSYPAGSFIYRLAGRDREKSASYYTPEVLTQCVVKYSLKELLPGKRADDILRLRLCEMALGSGAFGNEGLNQLADAYLERKQSELGRRIPADAYQAERQQVKAYLAVNNFYGVDLNPTAVELARVSLWLNVIYEGAETPWFGPRLAVGNSLIGARRQVYSAADITSGAYRNKAPTLAPLGQPRPAGSVYHWLLPDAGMAAFDNDKVIAGLAPDAVKAIKAWRKGFTAKTTANELAVMQRLSDRADALWESHLNERRAMLEATRQVIPVWGQDDGGGQRPAPDRDALLVRMYRPTGPYARLKLALDYWCSLWFWPIPEADKLPGRADFLKEMGEIFAASGEEFEGPVVQQELFPEAAPPRQTGFGELQPVSVDELRTAFPRLRLADETAAAQRFHHWELAFPEVFADGGGFDLTLGNPPWVLVEFDEGGVLADFDPLVAVRKLSATQVADVRPSKLTDRAVQQAYFEEFVEQTGIKNFLGAVGNYPLLAGKQNLYKCFVTRSWEIGTRNGVAGFLHPEGLYDDPKGGSLRSKAYPRLRKHFQFHNEFKLFADVHNETQYSVNIYATTPTPEMSFDHIVNLFHPATVDRCYAHNGTGIVPAIKDENENWEVRGHRNRIVQIRQKVLELFATLYDEPDTAALQARLASVHSVEIVTVLQKLALQARKLGDIPYFPSPSTFWNETNASNQAIIKRDVRFPSHAGEWILSGPHIFVATPFNKTPNEGCRSNKDYTRIDLTSIPDDYLPRTNYVPGHPLTEFTRRIPRWKDKPITDQYRHVHRRMLSQTGERTLVSSIVPPQVTYLNFIFSLNFETTQQLVEFSGLCSSLAYDFYIKTTGKADLQENLARLLPLPEPNAHLPLIVSRTLQLNCLTTHYADLWQDLYDPAFNHDGWSKTDPRLRPWSDLTPHWQRHVALRTPFERRQALVEIDVLAAMALGLTLDELLTIYRVQFPVLQQNERRLRFDQAGMEVPVKTTAGELVVDETHPDFASRIPPFTPVDREADYRVAWTFFNSLAVQPEPSDEVESLCQIS